MQLSDNLGIDTNQPALVVQDMIVGGSRNATACGHGDVSSCGMPCGELEAPPFIKAFSPKPHPWRTTKRRGILVIQNGPFYILLVKRTINAWCTLILKVNVASKHAERARRQKTKILIYRQVQRAMVCRGDDS